MKLDTMASSMDMELVSAAKSTMQKKSIPTKRPAGPIAWNTLGMDMNMSPGPDALIPSSPMNTNTAGIIITPASTATPVSKISI